MIKRCGIKWNNYSVRMNNLRTMLDFHCDKVNNLYIWKCILLTITNRLQKIWLSITILKICVSIVSNWMSFRNFPTNVTNIASFNYYHSVTNWPNWLVYNNLHNYLIIWKQCVESNLIVFICPSRDSTKLTLYILKFAANRENKW